MRRDEDMVKLTAIFIPVPVAKTQKKTVRGTNYAKNYGREDTLYELNNTEFNTATSERYKFSPVWWHSFHSFLNNVTELYIAIQVLI
jgi:hypothetical protein